MTLSQFSVLSSQKNLPPHSIALRTGEPGIDEPVNRFSGRLMNLYCSGFAGVPALTPECFFTWAINSRTLSLPS
jgi:hypothetical protein